MAPDDDGRRWDTEGFRQARRRLVRGSFAVPTVLTVVSGRALAMTTAQQRSLSKEFVQPQYPPAVNDPPPTGDTWVRVRAYKGQGTGKAQFISGAQLPAGSSGLPPFMSSVQALCVVDGGPYNKGTIYNTIPASSGTSTQWYAVLFDSAGTVKGIANVYPSSSTGTAAVHQSVLASIVV